MMLTLAWMVSFICSVPQTIIFSSLTHPDIEKFTQCVTFAFFSDNNPNEKKVLIIIIHSDVISFIHLGTYTTYCTSNTLDLARSRAAIQMCYSVAL